MKRLLAAFVILCSLLAWPLRGGSAELPSPEEYFRFTPGADRMLIDYEDLIGYLHQLDDASLSMKMEEIGRSPLGRKMYVVFISSRENLGSIESLVEINRALALDHEMSDSKREAMIEKGRVFFTATLSMHSNELGPSQAAPLIAYQLLSRDDEKVRKWLEDVVYMMVPCHNPDGMDMVVNHYRKYKGTKYEGARMPGVYHKYVGHDNNRDFINISQSDTRAVSFIFSRDYFPQVMVEKHQMGSRGVRYFVPPNHDPIAMNIDAGIWNWAGIFGANMMKDMTLGGLAGVSQHYLFDDYWPGSTETCIWKNVTGFLTECASAKHATPVYIEPNELSVIGKGLSEYEKSVNMPLPWKGGWWKLSDIVEYEIVSTMSIIKTCSLHREDILRFRNDLCRREVDKGLTEAPYYYIMPAEQHDPSALASVVNLLLDHGLEVHRLKEQAVVEGRVYGKGSVVVKMAQPFRPFAKEVLEHQRYPVRHYTPGGQVIKPYEITSWSLPLYHGVECVEISSRSKDLEGKLAGIEPPYSLYHGYTGEIRAIVFPASNNESYRAAFKARDLGLEVRRTLEPFSSGSMRAGIGSFIIEVEDAEDKVEELTGLLSVDPIFLPGGPELKSERLNVPRIGLVETWFHDMDAGWTRYLLDSYLISYKVIRPSDLKEMDLEEDFDLLIFADRGKSVFMSGKWRRKGEEYDIPSYPPEYREGMGEKGHERLISFIEHGGVVVSWGGSVSLFEGILKIGKEEKDKEEFKLPFDDISDQLKKDGVYCPGSTMRAVLSSGHPLTFGMEEEIGVMFHGGPVFSTTVPDFDMDRAVIARFSKSNILMSGYCEKEEKLSEKTLMVWLKKGKGQLVLFGFRPQFRASTAATFKLLFNSILLPRES